VATPPAKFVWPLEGELFTDFYISNYVDLDPRRDDADLTERELRDFGGGTITTDGHDGIDIASSTFERMDEGIPIVASASGIVIATHDGEFDRRTAFSSPPPAANFVTIDHGGGWQTSYFHLRRDSVTVVPGQQVRAGELLGLMGSSGQSTGSHLHFNATHNGRPVATMLDPATFYVDPPRYALDAVTLIDSGITNFFPVSHRIERPSDVNTFSQASGQPFTAWFVLSGVNEDDRIEFFTFRPNGSLFSKSETTALNDAGGSLWSTSLSLPQLPETGTWRAEIQVNGRLVGTDFFEVTRDGAPEMRIDQANRDIILDERFTPIDFGTATRSQSAPTRRFTVVNHGSDDLHFTALTVPTGFALQESLPSTLAPGASDTFTVALSTVRAGYFAGQVRVLSDDADEGEYNFSVEGLVRDTGPLDNLTLGIGAREIGESGRTVANVTRSGDLS